MELVAGGLDMRGEVECVRDERVVELAHLFLVEHDDSVPVESGAIQDETAAVCEPGIEQERREHPVAVFNPFAGPRVQSFEPIRQHTGGAQGALHGPGNVGGHGSNLGFKGESEFHRFASPRRWEIAGDGPLERAQIEQLLWLHQRDSPVSASARKRAG